MDYKYIEHLLDRYFEAETSLEEEQILRAFFSQENIPAEMEQWRALFTSDNDILLGDDFDARIMEAIEEQPAVKAREVSLTQRLMPLFKAVAVVAIIITIGSALQAPWDKSWNNPQDYAKFQQDLDSVAAVSPVQAENIGDWSADSASIMMLVMFASAGSSYWVSNISRESFCVASKGVTEDRSEAKTSFMSASVNKRSSFSLLP